MRRRSITASLAQIATLGLLFSTTSVPALAQDAPRLFAGALVGVSTLSADGRAVTSAADAALSMYKPENGWAISVFAGAHVAEYFSIQGNWMWNRNDITLVSSFASLRGGAFYEQRRHSHQHAAVLDGLLYFRRRDSAIRPYLGTGLSVTHFSSADIVSTIAVGLDPPSQTIASTRLALRSHVGIDVRLSRHVSFRYSFSETIGGNPISPALTPPAPRQLANFQNLFGLLARF